MITAVRISATQRPAGTIRAPLSDKAIGILLASAIPAIFWTGLVAFVGSVLGQTPSVATLITIGTGIATFLAVIVGCLVARRA